MHRAQRWFVAVLLLVLAATVGAGPATESGLVARSAGSVSSAASLEHHAIGWYSSNWAGYVTRTGTYTKVSGQWTVPSVSTRQTGFSAAWLGIGGVSSDDLIQVGTEQDSINGRGEYWAWWEILPAAAVEIRTFRVRPGDRITATIARVSGSTWRITISNAGHGSFTTTQTWHGDGTSAEWIMEAPVVGRHVGRLANFSLTTFDHLLANGKNPRLSSSQSGALIQNGVRVATPSVPDPQRDGFRIRRSSSAPSPPG
jgi:peptidase A4-like protein